MDSEDTEISKLFEKAREFKYAEDYEKEIQVYDKILELDSSDYRVWVDKGYAYLQLGKFENALICYNRAIEIDPNDTNAWYNKGVALAEMKKFEEAIDAFKKLLEIDPEDIGALVELARQYQELERWNDVIRILDSVLENGLKDERAWGYWAFAKLQQRKLDEAKKGYMESIKLDPSNDSGIYNLACVLSLQNQVQDALKYLKKAIYMDDYWVDSAKEDKDFDNIREMEEFKEFLKYKMPDFESPLEETRYRLMEILEPSDLRIPPSKDLPRVWAIIMDVPIDDTWYSLVCIAEGSVSLYFGNGGGIIGAGEHESVWVTAKKYLMKAEEVLDKMGDFTPTKLDDLEKVTFHVLLHDGRHSDSAKEDELVIGEEITDHYLAELYDLAQAVITEIRLKSPGPE